MDNAEDWDACASGNVNRIVEKQPETSTLGKTFGSRGRGFSPFKAKSLGLNAGWTHSHASGDNWFSNKRNGDDDLYARKDSRNDSGEKYIQEKRSHFCAKDKESRGKQSKSDENGFKPIPKSSYIPEDPTEDDNEIFGNGISSGINFRKYDDIVVKVSGENPPAAIHSFEEAGLRSILLDLVQKCSYSKPTPIQKHAIPIIMSGRDIMACAQTGSGKTAAFLIPIIHQLLEDRTEVDTLGACTPQAIIISPTRELAIQIFHEARKFSRGSILKVAISYGGTSVAHQFQNMMKGCNILVATPGRLLDFLGRNRILLNKVKFIVLDEADRMLDLGFLPPMETLLGHPTLIPQQDRQTCMFSATFPEEIQRLAGKFLHDYLFVAVGIVGGACSDVEQRFFCVTKFEKRRKLIDLLTEEGSKKCLIFVEQKRTTDFLATFLCEKDFPATSIHGDREQREREEALRDFKGGRMDILVATSVAARGLDIKNVAHVINFDLPKSVDEYVHRIGRTGRVGNRGLATSFYDPDIDKPIASDLVKIIRQAGQAVPDFLKGEGLQNSNGGPAKFGGRDFRNERTITEISRAQVSTFEEEEW